MKALAYILSLPLALMAAGPAAAQASVVIWPVDPQIQSTEQATALWLENRGTLPVALQVRSFGWNQASGEDSYLDQDRVVASPPIATVGPGQRQLVRVIRRLPDAAGEHAYRLVVDELPAPRPPSDGSVSANLAVQMRYSIPLFTHGDKASTAAPSLSSRIELAGGKRWLIVSNSGNLHARLSDLRVRGHGSDKTLRSGLVGYVLSGATMRWELPDDLAGDATFTVAVNGADQTLGRAS